MTVPLLGHCPIGTSAGRTLICMARAKENHRVYSRLRLIRGGTLPGIRGGTGGRPGSSCRAPVTGARCFGVAQKWRRHLPAHRSRVGLVPFFHEMLTITFIHSLPAMRSHVGRAWVSYRVFKVMVMAAVEEAPAGDAPKRKKFSGKKLVLFILLPVLLLGGGGAAAYFLLLKKDPAVEDPAAAAEEDHASEEPQVYVA